MEQLIEASTYISQPGWEVQMRLSAAYYVVESDSETDPMPDDR